MALQTFNWANLPVQESPYGNLIEDIFKGYQIGRAPEQMNEEQLKRQLANKLSQMEVEHKPTEYALSDQQKRLAAAIQSEALKYLPKQRALDEEYKRAQIEKLKNPFRTQLKPSGELANWIFSHPDATQDQIKEIGEKLFNSNLKKQETLRDNKEKYASSIAWRSMPADTKRQAIAKAVGMGYDPVEAEQKLSSGSTLLDLASDKNMDLDDAPEIYPIDKENIKQMQRRTAFVKELKALDKHISEGQAPYSQKIFNLSLDQVAEAMDADYQKNPHLIDKQAKFLASRALGPEMTALRLKVAGGNIGIEALRELNEKALNNSRIVQSLVTPQVYIKMQEYMSKWLEEANNEYNKALSDMTKYRTSGNDFSNSATNASFDFSKFPVAGGR